MKVLKKIGWVLLVIILTGVFTVFKIPDAKIRDSVVGMLNQQLGASGMSLTVNEGRLTFLTGLKFKMKGISIQSATSPNPIKLEELEVSPSILKLISGKPGGTAVLRSGTGKLEVSFWSAKADYGVDFQADKFNLAQLGVLESMIGIPIGALVTGKGSLKGNSLNFSPLEGDIDLDIKDLTTEESNIQGFKIPKVSISEGKIGMNFGGGKGRVKTFRLGKAGGADDLVGTATGELTLGRHFINSKLDLTVEAAISDKIRQAFPPIDLFIGAAKKSDGTYAMKVTGEMAGPVSAVPLDSAHP